MMRAALSALSVLAACALSSGTAWGHYRILGQLESSYELLFDAVTLPRNTAGSLVFKECRTCETRSIRVSGATRYFVNGAETAFADFQRVAQEIEASTARNAAAAVYVHYDTGTLRVNRIRLSEPGATAQ